MFWHRKPQEPPADTDAQLPPPVKLLLGEHLDGRGEPTHFARADINAAGVFGQTWVALAGDTLAVVDLDHADGPRVRLHKLAGEVDVQILQGWGCSRLRLTRDGRLEEELRFSARQARRFSELQHRAQAQIKGQREPDAPMRAVAPPQEKLCGKCGRLIPDWADTCPRCLYKRKILWRLMAYALPYRSVLITGAAAALLATLLGLAPPYLAKHLINDVLTDGPDRKPWLLWPLIGILAGVMLLRLVLGYLRLNRFARLSELMTHDLRRQTFDHMQKLSLAYYAKKPTGNLINRVTSDTERLWDFVAFGIVDIALSLVMLAGIMVIMFSQEPLLAALTLLPVPIALFMMWLHVKRIHRMLTRLWTKWSRMTSVLSDVIPGARVVKAFTQENREGARFERRSRAVVDDALVVHQEWTTFWPRLSFVLQCGTLLIWMYAGPRILGGKLDLGTFWMFLGYVAMFYGPVEHLGMMNRMIQRAVTSAHRVFEVLDTPPLVFSHSNALRPGRVRGAVRLENVSFSYDGVKRVLQDVSFEVQPGEVIGLAGPSGGGKTTLINLLCRFYDPIDGRILIDGIDLRDMDVHELRAQIGLVLQEPYLFHGSVAQNIAYGCPDADRDRILTAARIANAHDFIVGFPDGYDTLVGERGQTVSGGERQRLSIARAVINEPRILIFDEATSSVDSKTELRIQEAIDRLVQGRTTFAIAHRLSTLRRASRLLILDKGKLVEEGTHDQLLGKDGVYANLHKTQSELHALFAV